MFLTPKNPKNYSSEKIFLAHRQGISKEGILITVSIKVQRALKEQEMEKTSLGQNFKTIFAASI